MFYRLCKAVDPNCKDDVHATTVDGKSMERAGLSEEEKERLWERTTREVFTFQVVGFGVVIGR